MRTRFNPYAVAAFEAVFRRWMHRRLAGPYVRRSVDLSELSGRVVLVANHVSWWDGFLLRELHLACGRGGPLYTLMRADQVARFPFFAWMGVIGLTDEPARVKHALRYLDGLGTSYWLSFFPQGSIWPSWKRPLGFQRGIEVFARHIAPCTIVPVALHLEPLAALTPSAFVGVGAPRRVSPGDVPDAGALEADVEGQLDELMDVLASYGESAGRAWASPEPTMQTTGPLDR